MLRQRFLLTFQGWIVFYLSRRLKTSLFEYSAFICIPAQSSKLCMKKIGFLSILEITDDELLAEIVLKLHHSLDF